MPIPETKGYIAVKISASIGEEKLKKAVRSGKITIKAEDLKGSKEVMVHPANAKMILRAQAKGRGVTSMPIAAGDIMYDIEVHQEKSIWYFVEGLKTKKVYNWIY